MGNGFPGRCTRKALGLAMADDGTAEPGADVAGKEINLAWWTAAGVSGLVPRAWALLVPAAGALPATPSASWEGWNSEKDPSLGPTVAYIALGHFTLTYQAAYADEDSYADPTVTANSPLTLYGVHPKAQSNDPIFQASGTVTWTGSLWVVDLYVKNVNANTAADKPVLALVY